MSRISDLTEFSERLTPGEVAQVWFRWGRDKAAEIHVIHPNFPKPGPDGLYLREQVKEWFSRFHGWRKTSSRLERDKEEALRVGQNGGSHTPSSH